MFEPINLSAYTDPLLDELVSGEPHIDDTLFLQIMRQVRGPILELGCGYGRITIPLAQRGVNDLTGLDLSAPSLAHARTKAGTLPIRWVEADVRDFHLGRQYALIFARGNVFDFMLTRRDQDSMLACVHEHLADDGHFMFDVAALHPSQMVTSPEEEEEEAWFTLHHPSGRPIVVSGTDRVDGTRHCWTQTCYERWDGPTGDLVRSPWTLTLRYATPRERESVLQDNGFRIVAQYVDYDGTPETVERPASVYICAKH